VTISYNVFHDHDKVSLIGSSDSRTTDRDHLKVTLHHNYYKDLTQRLPRVRYGQVHIYNNYYEFSKESDYEFDYALGVGIESKIYAENNYFHFDYDIDPGQIIKDWKGTSIYEDGSYVGGKSSAQQVDLVEAFNKSHDLQLSENVGWKPSLFTNIHPAQAVPALVKAKAGAGNAR
jgi:pectate lyase